MAFTDEHANLYLLGKNYLAHQFLGAHLNRDKNNNVVSTTFSVYAPNAKEVRLIADFNNYEGWKHVLSKIHPQGFWSITIPLNLEWATYKYE
ncbi:MAG: 1,4-alpha-glucan branching enzyme, partial [Acholeplasma sp.]